MKVNKKELLEHFKKQKEKDKYFTLQVRINFDNVDKLKMFLMRYLEEDYEFHLFDNYFYIYKK